MTTIATDGRSMAGDSLVTSNGEIVGYTTKVFRLEDGRIAGCCGRTSDIPAALLWLDKPQMKKPDLEEGFEALVLYAEGRVQHYGYQLVAAEFLLPQAIGSGGDLALGAMLAGKNPIDAVEIAAQRDTKTGGNIIDLALE